jgi:long-chain acyl-CoA synthetase
LEFAMRGRVVAGSPPPPGGIRRAAESRPWAGVERPHPAGEPIPFDAARTLSGLLARRVERTPEGVAYRQFEGQGWRDYRWREVADGVARWQGGLAGEGLQPGDRVALSLPNGIDWVCFDQAALGLGLVTVPLYTTDSPGNLAHILGDSGARLLLLDSDERWAPLAALRSRFPGLLRVLCRRAAGAVDDPILCRADDWLPADGLVCRVTGEPDALATLVYTSGTTGLAKGVMLSHRNILSNAEAVMRRIPALPTDVFLSFLPLAHAFERTAGYYLPMMAGSCVAYARSVDQLREDLLQVRPTVLLSVPRIYDKIYLAIQARLGARGFRRRLFERMVAIGWRRFEAASGRGPALRLPDRLLWPLLRQLAARPVLDRLGGHLRVAVSGGAPLSPVVARCFVGLGLPLTEGYGLTEAAPVVTNIAPEAFVPGCVGLPLPGTETRIGAQDELLVRGPSVMQGYWGQPDATAQVLDASGWLHTGDVVETRDGYIAIRGRLKEILVTSTGEKVPPADMEMALTMDPLIEQALVVGEGRPFLAALLVLAPAPWKRLAAGLGLDPGDPGSLADPSALAAVLARAAARLGTFPGHAQVRALHLSLVPWTVDNGLLTPTMKLKRPELEDRFATVIDALYEPRQRPCAAPAQP